MLWVTRRLLVANQVFLGNYSKPDLLRTSSTLGYDERNPVEFCIDETGCVIMMHGSRFLDFDVAALVVSKH